MLIKQGLQSLFDELMRTQEIPVNLGSVYGFVRFFKDHEMNFSLCSPIYVGKDYLPNSVRQSISKHPPFLKGGVKTFLTIDESQFSIYLNYQAHLEKMTLQIFTELLEEFSYQANEWYFFLEGKDREDLVHIRVR